MSNTLSVPKNVHPGAVAMKRGLSGAHERFAISARTNDTESVRYWLSWLVCSGSLADIGGLIGYVRSTPNSGHVERGNRVR